MTRRQFPHRDRARTASTSTTATAIMWRRIAFALFPQARRRKRRRARLLSRRRADEGGNRLAARQALRAGRAARLGLRAPTPEEDRTRLRKAGHTLRGQRRRGANADDPRNHRHDRRSPTGDVHIAPLGIIAEGEGWIIAPFRPSTTLDNLRGVPFAVANYTDDVRVFAGCLTGRRDWPTMAADARAGAASCGCARACGAAGGRGRRGRRSARGFTARGASRRRTRRSAGFNRAQAAVSKRRSS